TRRKLKNLRQREAADGMVETQRRPPFAKSVEGNRRDRQWDVQANHRRPANCGLRWSARLEPCGHATGHIQACTSAAIVRQGPILNSRCGAADRTSRGFSTAMGLH